MEEVSPSASPGDLTRQRDVPVHGRRLSTEGSLSSEEVLEENVKDFLPVPAEGVFSLSFYFKCMLLLDCCISCCCEVSYVVLKHEVD